LRESSACLDERIGSLRRVYIAVGINRYAFSRGALIHAILTLEGRDERHDAILVHRSDAHAVAPVRMVQRTPLRADPIERLALDEDPAGTAEHVARLEVFPLLIENLETVVATIGHPQPALRVERERVRRAELAVTKANRPPRLDELAVGRE